MQGCNERCRPGGQGIRDALLQSTALTVRIQVLYSPRGELPNARRMPGGGPHCCTVLKKWTVWCRTVWWSQDMPTCCTVLTTSQKSEDMFLARSPRDPWSFPWGTPVDASIRNVGRACRHDV